MLESTLELFSSTWFVALKGQIATEMVFVFEYINGNGSRYRQPSTVRPQSGRKYG